MTPGSGASTTDMAGTRSRSARSGLVVPPAMDLFIWPGSTTQRLPCRHPTQPVFWTPGLSHHMHDRVVRPEAQRLEFGGGPRLVLGSRINPGFFQPEDVHSQQGAVARLVLIPERQGPRRPIPHSKENTEKPTGYRGTPMHHKVKRERIRWRSSTATAAVRAPSTKWVSAGP